MTCLNTKKNVWKTLLNVKSYFAEWRYVSEFIKLKWTSNVSSFFFHFHLKLHFQLQESVADVSVRKKKQNLSVKRSPPKTNLEPIRKSLRIQDQEKRGKFREKKVLKKSKPLTKRPMKNRLEDLQLEDLCANDFEDTRAFFEEIGPSVVSEEKRCQMMSNDCENMADLGTHLQSLKIAVIQIF